MIEIKTKLVKFFYEEIKFYCDKIIYKALLLHIKILNNNKIFKQLLKFYKINIIKIKLKTNKQKFNNQMKKT